MRRARLQGAVASDASAVTPEVLVLAADDASREQLCALLRAFGFGVHAVAKQSVLTEARPIVAVFVAERLRPIDHVRAKLAGCDEVLLKPVTRGSVARVLDGHGVALPSDARHL